LNDQVRIQPCRRRHRSPIIDEHLDRVLLFRGE